MAKVQNENVMEVCGGKEWKPKTKKEGGRVKRTKGSNR